MVDAGQHLLQAPDFVWIVASGYQVLCSGEINGKLQCFDVEIHGVVVKGFQVFAWGFVYVFPALLKGLIPSIESLGKIWDRAAQVS